jgi:hypothetical protein
MTGGNRFNVAELTQLAGMNSWKADQPTAVAATMASVMASRAPAGVLYDPTASRYQGWLRSSEFTGPMGLDAALEGGVDTEGFSAIAIEVSQSDGVHAAKADPVWFYPMRRDNSVLDSSRWDEMAQLQRRRVNGADNLAHKHLDSRAGSGKHPLVDVANLAELNLYLMNAQAIVLNDHGVLDNNGNIPEFYFDVLGPARHWAGSRAPECMSPDAPTTVPFLAGVVVATAAASNHPASNPAFSGYAASDAAVNAAEASFTRGTPPAGNITMSIQDHGRAELKDLWPKLSRTTGNYVQGESLNIVIRPALVNLDKRDVIYTLPADYYNGAYEQSRPDYPTSHVPVFVESAEQAKKTRCAWMYYAFPLAIPTASAAGILRASWFSPNQRSPPRGSMSWREYQDQQMYGWDPKKHSSWDRFRDAIAVLPLAHRSGYTPANSVPDEDYVCNYPAQRSIGHMTVAMLNEIGRVITTYQQ